MLPKMIILYVIAPDSETITPIQGVGFAIREPCSFQLASEPFLRLPTVVRPRTLQMILNSLYAPLNYKNNIFSVLLYFSNFKFILT